MYCTQDMLYAQGYLYEIVPKELSAAKQQFCS